MADEQKDKKKVRVPTPIKRRRQDDKKQLRNRIWKSRVHSLRVDHAKETDQEKKKTILNSLYSLLDKAFKNGIFKKNKVARLKSRLAQKTPS